MNSLVQIAAGVQRKTPFYAEENSATVAQALVDKNGHVMQPVYSASAAQAAVTPGNTNSEIGGLTIGATYSQAEVTALRDKCEELADDLRNTVALTNALRLALVNAGLIKGAA